MDLLFSRREPLVSPCRRTAADAVDPTVSQSEQYDTKNVNMLYLSRQR
jgi:hypothetical protein